MDADSQILPRAMLKSMCSKLVFTGVRSGSCSSLRTNRTDCEPL